MKRIIIVAIVSLLLGTSCNKENCKDKQDADLKTEAARFQHDMSLQNLSQQQIQNLIDSHNKRQAEILAECN